MAWHLVKLRDNFPLPFTYLYPFDIDRNLLLSLAQVN
jgi:hypothetical protein